MKNRLSLLLVVLFGGTATAVGPFALVSHITGTFSVSLQLNVVIGGRAAAATRGHAFDREHAIPVPSQHLRPKKT
jgi:hypothetical protein